VEELQRARSNDKESSADAAREHKRSLKMQGAELETCKSNAADHAKVEHMWREEVTLLKTAKDELQRRNEHQEAELTELQV